MKNLALITWIVSSVAFAVPEQIENKKFEPPKAPVLEESRPSDQFSKAEWEQSTKALEPDCKRGALWVLHPTESKIEGIAFKEKTVPVKGAFARVAAVARTGKSGLNGEGSLDLSSWDSLLPARDYRVMKYVFGVEEKGNSVVPFRFHVAQWNPAKKEWKATLKLSFHFRGQAVSLDIPATFKAEKGKVTAVAAQAKRFTFLTDKNVPGMEKLMELCNHHFLASYADVSFSAVFEESCHQHAAPENK
ncbi:hypothetical protein K2X33_10795 [bacterium]|nr:hypothetical protein [bacterium]